MNIDPRALLIVGGYGCWMLAAVIEFQAVRPSTRRVAPDPWTIGMLAQGLGLNLISQRGLIADLWSIDLANVLLLTTPLLCHAALQRVRGVRTNLLLILAAPVTVGLLLPIIGFSEEAFALRAVVVMCAAMFGVSLCLWSVVQLARAGFVAGASLILGSGAGLAMCFVAFAWSVVHRDIQGIFSAQGTLLLLYGMNDVAILLSTLGYMDISRAVRNRIQAPDPALQPDRLTGLYSHDAFTRSGTQEMQRAQGRSLPVCAMTIQIDEFESLKSTHGQKQADLALKRIAALVMGEIRLYDLAGRWTENRIGVVMPELSLSGASEIAERIRALVENEPADFAGSTRLAISIGLCETGSETSLDAVMLKAGACLEHARIEGGNRVFTPESAPSRRFVEGTV